MSTKKSVGRNDRDNGRDDDRGDRHVIAGSRGDDDGHDHRLVIAGTNGNDSLTGTAGVDTIIGRDGNDTLFGLAGNDNIDGGKGNDEIDGGDGNDRLNGGQGDDILTGGAGNDYIDGGPHGHDIAVFSGKYLDYTISFSAGPLTSEGYKITVVDNRTGSPDGTDMLRRVDVLVFADGEYRDGQFLSYNTPAEIGIPPVSSVTEDTDVTGENLVASGTILISDPDGQEQALFLTTVAPAQGNLGTLTLDANGDYTYTVANSAVQYLGGIDTKVDSFTITSLDGTTKLVNFTIRGTNDLATISGTVAGSVVEAGGVNNADVNTPTANGTLTASDIDTGQNVFQVPTSLAGTYGNFTFTETTGEWQYTLNPDRSDGLTQGQVVHDNLTVTSADGTATQVIDVTITGTNDAATLSTSAATVVEGAAVMLLATNLAGADVDDGNSQLTYTVGALPARGTLYLNGAALVAGGTFTQADVADGKVSYTHDGSETLSDSFAVTLSDGQLSTGLTTLALTVIPVNDAPTLRTFGATVDEGATMALSAMNLAGADVDNSNSELTYTVGTLPTHGTLYLNGTALVAGGTFTQADVADGKLSYTHDGSETLSDSLAVILSDGQLSTGLTTLALTVNPVNEPPMTTPLTLAAIGEDDEPRLITQAELLANASDVDGPSLSATNLAIASGSGTLVDNGNGTWNYTPALNDDTAVSFNYAVTDGTLTTAGSATLDITPVNDAPVAVADTNVGDAVVESGHNPDNTPFAGDATAVGDVLTNDTDADADATRTVSAVNGVVTAVGATITGTYGNVVIASDGKYTYTLNNADTDTDALAQGANASDVFNYTVADEFGATSTATLTINITGTNDAPALTAPVKIDFDTTLPDAGRQVWGQLSTDDVDDNATQTYSISGGVGSNLLAGYNVAAAGTYGTLYLNITNGNYEFVYNAAVDALVTPGPGILNGTGSDSFTVTVTDEWFASDRKLLTIDLTGTNDATVISGVMPFNYTVGELAKVVAPGLTLSDPDSNLVTWARVVVSDGFTDADVLSFDTTALPAGWTATRTQIGALPAPSDPWIITTLQGSMTAIYDEINGVLDIGGSGTLADYTALLDLVTFHADVAGAGGRTVSFQVSDGSVDSLITDTSNLSLLNLSTNVLKLPGVSEGDSSGFSVSAAGDVNHDGYGDLIIGAPWANDASYVYDPDTDTWSGIAGIGRSYVVYGKPSGMAVSNGELPLASIDPANDSGFSVSGASQWDGIGFSVRAGGDVNGDGFSDIIVGSPYSDQNGVKAGLSYVVFGRATNANITDSSLNGIVGFKVIGGVAGDYAGYSVSGAGDVNGDGFSDVMIGAPKVDAGKGVESGAAYVLFGHAGSFAATVDLGSPLGSSTGFAISGANAHDWTGASVSSAGDVNGDGITDMMIGTATPADPATGAVSPASASAYVVFGNSSGFGSSLDLSALDGANGFSVINAGTGERIIGFGNSHYAVRSAGDVNGDGFGDMIIGAPYASTIHGSTGAAYVVFGHPGDFSPTVDLSHIENTQGFEILGVESGDRAGYAVSAAGDVNGDGYGDLIIGAPSAIQNGSPAGTSYLVFGTRADFGTVDAATGIATVDLANLGNDGFRISAAAPNNDSGYSVSAAGDVNGDGFADLLVSSSAASPHLGGEGESYVIFGSKFITTPNTQVGSDPPGATTTFVDGTTEDDIFVAGQGNATMVGGGGVDSFSGGVGNDTIRLGASGTDDSRFLKIDGGGGFDTLSLYGSGMTLDLTAPGVGGRVHNIERIDLTGSGDNTLKLDIQDLLNMSDTSNQLIVEGNNGDEVILASSAWVPNGPVTLDSITYNSYTTVDLIGVANLLIGQDLTVSVIT